jgi:hypothetical protein
MGKVTGISGLTIVYDTKAFRFQVAPVLQDKVETFLRGRPAGRLQVEVQEPVNRRAPTMVSQIAIHRKGTAQD